MLTAPASNTTTRPSREGQSAASRWNRWESWDGDEAGGGARVEPLTREQAQSLSMRNPPLSPWRVIAGQAALGVAVAVLAALFTGSQAVAWSVLYGAATVVMPGALMARGMTSRLSSVSPAASAVSVLLWEMVKVGFSIAMLVVANRVVQPLVWPALLVGLVVCMKVYLLALLWGARRGTVRTRIEMSETQRHGS